VITAVGMTNHYSIMAAAIIIAIILMIFASDVLSNFVNRYPSIKMLALSFLILVGSVLIAEGVHYHIPRAYLYVAIGFAMGVEFLNRLNERENLLES